MGDNNYSGDSEKLSYDLRQIYALEIIGETLKRVLIYKSTRQYSLWFHSLRDLNAPMRAKVNKKEDLKKLEKLFTTAKKIISENPDVFLGEEKDNESEENIYQSIDNIECYIYELFEKYKFFGQQWDEDGL